MKIIQNKEIDFTIQCENCKENFLYQYQNVKEETLVIKLNRGTQKKINYYIECPYCNQKIFLTFLKSINK